MIHEAITGSQPEDGSRFRTVDSLLPVFERAGWTIVDDATVDLSADGPHATRRTVRLERRSPPS